MALGDYGPSNPRLLSPERLDPLSKLEGKQRAQDRSFKDNIEEQRVVELDNPKTSAATRKRRWDVPTPSASDIEPEKQSSVGLTPRPGKSRWDMTPARAEGFVDFGFSTPGGFFPRGFSSVSADDKSRREELARNIPFTDEVLDSLLPSEGYEILQPPAGYIPLITPARKLTMTPKSEQGFMQAEGTGFVTKTDTISAGDDMPTMKLEDVQFFGKLLGPHSEEDMTMDELKERKVLRLLLKIKNGGSQMRRQSMRHISERARDLGAGPIFDALLPLMLSPSLTDPERHTFVKLIDRLLFKFDAMIRPYVHKILVVIEPLLIDEDYLVRIEGREILSNLAKAAGLATMLSAMRPDIDNSDEYVRNITARALAIVASALGIDALLPFIQAACRSKKSWLARHTGVKIIQQIAILMGCGVLPYLKEFCQCAVEALRDEEHGKVRTIGALALSALAEASFPFGKDMFKSTMDDFWPIIRKERGKTFAACLKAFGNVVPLLEVEYCNFYTEKLSSKIISEFDSPDDDLRRVIMQVLRQLSRCRAMDDEFWMRSVCPRFFDQFWSARVAGDRRSYRLLVETTTSLLDVVKLNTLLEHLSKSLKDTSEDVRQAACEVVFKILSKKEYIAFDSDDLCDRIADSLSFAFQEQTSTSQIYCEVFALFLSRLGGLGVKFHPSTASMILWRISNKSPLVRQLAADLASAIAPSLAEFGSSGILDKIGAILYENLAEEYPEVLGSILKALKSTCAALGHSKTSVHPQEILPRLTPILRNRNEKVQQYCVEFIGFIASSQPDAANAKEWMRICFELLDLLKAPRKAVRRLATTTFGFIAKGIGPTDVLIALLNNLKVQERQNRVCTTIAIAVVADACAPFTVIPSLMNEYRVPEMNVQNGVLKALAFLFEYIGSSSRDYMFALSGLLEDALTDRDLVHRQTACNVIKHMSLGSAGYGCEEALVHFLNHLLPNIFETSPHVIFSVIEALESLQPSLGSGVLFSYTLQGLFHPARRVREVYWRVYNNLYISSPYSLVYQYPSRDGEKSRSGHLDFLNVCL